MTKGWKKIVQLEHGRHENSLRKKIPMLQQLFWECTLKCNLRCRHCGSDCQVDDVRTNMPINVFLRVLDEISCEMNTHKMLVITTGGEPLMRHDIVECGRAIKERGFYNFLITMHPAIAVLVCQRFLVLHLEKDFCQSHLILLTNKSLL